MGAVNNELHEAAAGGTELDAIVIGAGFGGLYMLHKLRDEQGLKVRGFDKASDVGGTWYWNRYPGALSDSESFVYCYSFNKDLLQDWNFTTRYLTQPQILAYLEHVADRLDLRRDITFNTGVVSAHFDETRNLWIVRTDKGEQLTARFLVTALGLLSVTNIPEIKGRETFKGEQYHSGNWPKSISYDGKRVAVIGTGSTGTQIITAIAPLVKHLTVFQRSPQYTVPVGNGPVTPEYVAEKKRNYDAIWKHVRRSMVAMGFEESTLPTMSVSEEERQAIFQKAWDFGGGFRYAFETFNDIITDEAANHAAAEFIRGKIAEIVKDPETARKLTPHDYYAKRPLCDSGYYATFNRDNVTLVDVKATPIAEITPKGIRTADGVEHEVDMIIFATGFDAVDGNYKKIDIRGRGGRSIAEHWRDGESSHVAIGVAGFPNMFMIMGPNGPFANLPPAIEAQVEFVADTIAHVEANGLATIEPTQQAEDAWTEVCRDVADKTLLPRAESWIFGANIPGKVHRVLFYLGGLGAYLQELEAVKAAGYRGFVFRGEKPAVAAE